MLHDGEICNALTDGTELARFSVKGRRLVVIAAQTADVAFVYPLTSKKGEGRWVVDSHQGRSWLVVKHGLYALPLARLTSAGDRWTALPRLRELIQSHLRAREERSLQGDHANPLLQQPFRRLPPLPRLPPVASTESPETASGDEFEHYLRHQWERDLKEGRHRPD